MQIFLCIINEDARVHRVEVGRYGHLLGSWVNRVRLYLISLSFDNAICICISVEDTFAVDLLWCPIYCHLLSKLITLFVEIAEEDIELDIRCILAELDLNLRRWPDSVFVRYYEPLCALALVYKDLFQHVAEWCRVFVSCFEYINATTAKFIAMVRHIVPEIEVESDFLIADLISSHCEGDTVYSALLNSESYLLILYLESGILAKLFVV